MVPEAPLRQAATGLVPEGEGWFVLNARDALWKDGAFGAYARFEGTTRFPQLGLNLNVLRPGQPMSMYHGEAGQEGFLVLSGECLLLIEGEERRLRTWDFVHCPPWTEHVIVAAGEAPCLVLAVGSRTGEGVVYPRAEVAVRHGAGVEQETRSPAEAYERFEEDVAVPFREEWLPTR